MSKRYKSKKNDNFLYAISMLFFILCLLPAVPIFLFIVFIQYIFKMKGKLAVYSSLVLISIYCCIAFNQIAEFLQEMTQILQITLQNLLKGSFTPLTIYKVYSLESYILIFIVTLFLGGLYKVKLDKAKLLEDIGVKKLETEINKISENNNINTFMSDKKGVFIGVNTINKKKVYSSLDSKHIFVCGTTGSGKTVLLANYILDAIKKDMGLVIVDGKGDLGKGSILEFTEDFCKKYNRKLVVVNMNAPFQSDKYNPFLNTNETIAKDMLIGLTEWSEEHYKSNTERYLQRLIKLMVMDNQKLSLNKITDMSSKSEFEILSKTLEKQKIITKEEHMKNGKIIDICGEIAENAIARIAVLSESAIGGIFDENGIDIATAIEKDTVILFILNPLEYPILSPLFGKIILEDAKKAISKFYSNSNKKRKFYIFDEINVYASSVLIDLVNKSRSANVTNILATQSLSDLEMAVNETFKHQVIENCNNYIILRQNSYKDAEEWAKTLGTLETMKLTYQVGAELEEMQKGSARKVREFRAHPDKIKELGTGEAFYLSHDDNNQFAKIKINKPL